MGKFYAFTSRHIYIAVALISLVNFGMAVTLDNGTKVGYAIQTGAFVAIWIYKNWRNRT